MSAVNVAEVALVGYKWLYLPVVLDYSSCVLTQFKSLLLSIVRPEWSGERLKVTVFEDGTTNKLLGFYEEGRHADDTVLLRVNGVGTELFIDREMEITVMVALNKAGIASPVYCQIENGLCYGFHPGRYVPDDKISDPRMMAKTAQTLAKFHSVPVPEPLHDRKPRVWAKCDEWLKLASTDEFGDPRKNEVFRETIGSLDVLKRELEQLKTELSRPVFPVVLGHNDLTNRNVIYNKETDTMAFIDMEYSGPNYLAFDIGNHFCEYAGIDNPDYSKYPSEEVQKYFIRAYLEERARLRGEDYQAMVTNALVHSLYREANIFSLTSHLQWSIWGLLQSRYSLIDFDYLEYAGMRFMEYKIRKEEFLSIPL